MYGFIYWTAYAVVLFGGAVLIGLGLGAVLVDPDITTIAQIVAGAIWGWLVTEFFIAGWY